MIHSKDSYDNYGFRLSFEYWYEYDSNGNKIHEKNSDGEEEWYVYDSNVSVKPSGEKSDFLC